MCSVLIDAQINKVQAEADSGKFGIIGTEDVGQATLLASDEVSYITGSSIMVDNGMTAVGILVNAEGRVMSVRVDLSLILRR
jgi:enoyl-[acyl-carrier-protein] reductase (NADH)